MHRLSGEDAGFLAMEQPEQAMNTIALGLLRGADGGGTSLELSDVRAHVLARLDQLPSFRWRIVPVPFGLHQPMCVRDPDFDLDFHLREVTLSATETIDRRLARLGEQQLDRRHPLWQLTLVNGLPDGGQALILKYHHCLADGVAAFTTFSRVFSDAPTESIPGESLPWRPETIPGALTLVVLAVLSHLAALKKLPGLAMRTWRGTAAARARRAQAEVAVPEFSGAAPNSALNRAFTPERTYLRSSLSLPAAKALKDRAAAALDATVTLNDIVLATVSGGVRRYLVDRGELPNLPLLASVPVSYEPADAPIRQAGNRFWSFTTSLATDEAEPAERLRIITAVTAEAKRQLATLGEDLVPAWLDHVPPLISEPGARALIDRLETGPDTVDANIVISNIRGPTEPWTVMGVVVEDLYIDGPPSNGVGCNVMLWSYGDRLLLGILAFADALVDPEALGRHLGDSFAELEATFS